MCFAAAVLPFMNGIGKLLSETYPPEQVVWARFVSHLVWVVALTAPRLGTALFRSARPGLQAWRSMAMLSSSVIFFVALPHIGLAEASVINFVSPFLVMLLALPMLGERFVAHRLLGVTVGFLGVILVIRPGADVFNWASVAIFVSSAFYALYQVLTRMVAPHDRPETSILYSVLAGSVAMSLVMPWFWKTPLSVRDAVLFASLGFIGAVGHYGIARALVYAPASVISPFNYVQLIGAVGVGYVLFAALPDAWTWFGAVLIVGAGLFIGWREAGGRVQNSAPIEK